jgi:cytoskeletal protein RodZ
MGMGAMPSPAPYGYSGMQYPMGGQVYPQNVMPAIYQGVTPTIGQSTVPPEVQASKSREKSSQESSATSREHIQSPPPATSIQALTQQVSILHTR